MTNNSDNLYLNPPVWWWLVAGSGLVFLFLAGFGLLPLDITISNLLRSLFYGLVLIHFLEAVYVYRLSSIESLKSVQIYWTLQTLICGFWSIMLLNKVLRQLNS